MGCINECGEVLSVAAIRAIGGVLGIHMATRITKAARRLRPEFAENPDPYRWLSALRPGLMLDVGAAAGWMSDKMLESSPQSRVIAFEPFPGNHAFIEPKFADDPRRTLIKKAVSNCGGQAKFFVPSTVSNGLGVWAGMDGYSSGGRIVADTESRDALSVETCRLDDVVSEPVRFLKVDVQGHEFEVIDGARKLFDQHGVELALVEFQGDKRVVSFFAERGYALLDAAYLFSRTKAKQLKPADWQVLGSTNLSTGGTVITATPLNASTGPKAYCRWFEEQHSRYQHRVWTDLIAISPQSSLLKKLSLLSTIAEAIT